MAKFKLGKVVVTRGVLDNHSEVFQVECLNRHAQCDWGNVPEEDALENENALKHGNRILSSYKDTKGEELWIITEWDRSATTLLLPSEY